MKTSSIKLDKFGQLCCLALLAVQVSNSPDIVTGLILRKERKKRYNLSI